MRLNSLSYSQKTIWLAALLEGEGCFSIHNKGKYRPTLTVGLKMTDRDVVETTCKFTNYSNNKIHVIKHPKNPKWKITYGTSWTSSNAERLMRRVLPYMGERRSNKIEECLSLELSHHPRVNMKRLNELVPGIDEVFNLYDNKDLPIRTMLEMGCP